MTVILTSSPTGPLDKSRIVDGLDTKNGFIETLRKRWKADAKCLLIAASPAEPQCSDGMRDHLRGALEQSGLTVSAFDVWDDRTQDFSQAVLCTYDVIVLGGGHVPTQNAFFRRIELREKLLAFSGIVIGISAGSMNSADVVYAQPELPGESIDPAYQRFIPGLGLTRVNILPHYQMIRDTELDGKRVFEDITYPDSVGREFIALPDGGYLLSEQGSETLFGEAYRIADGKIEQICREDEQLVLSV